jgi:hypothetical protein
MHCMNVLRFPELMFHQNKHVNNMWRNRKAFLKWYREALLLACKDFVSQTRVWRTLHEDGLYPYRPQQVQNRHPGDNAMHLEFCHWLHTNCQLLPLILSTDEATFTCNGINNTWNSHRWSHDNPHSTVKTNFEHHFSIDVWCGTIVDLLIGLVILDDHVTGQNYLTFCKTDYQNN